MKHDTFYLGQIILGVGFVAAAWLFLRPKTPESNFRVREADRLKEQTTVPKQTNKDDLAKAKLKQPLSLPGIRIDGPAHEILGVPLSATAEQIHKAYRDLMKRYHPDRVGPAGSQAWKDAQKIAEALNQAKDEMLKRRR